MYNLNRHYYKFRRDQIIISKYDKNVRKYNNFGIFTLMRIYVYVK